MIVLPRATTFHLPRVMKEGYIEYKSSTYGVA